MTDAPMQVTDGGMAPEAHELESTDANGSPSTVVMRILFGNVPELGGRADWPCGVELTDLETEETVRLDYHAWRRMLSRWRIAVDRAYYASTEQIRGPQGKVEAVR